MLYNLKRIQDIEVNNKKVLLRLDLDLPRTEQLSPISNNVTLKNYDYFRLNASKKTLDYLIKVDAQIIVIGHMGRPDHEENDLSLSRIVPWFISNFGGERKEVKLGEFKGWEINENIILLENLRFYPGEEENELSFSKKLAELGDIFVNDAFGVVHRINSSVVGVSQLLPSYAGLHLQEEVKVLSRILENPDRPLALIIGGAKIETKLPLVEKMHDFADSILVGGEIAENTKVLLKVSHQKSKRDSLLIIADLSPDGDDITPVSFANFAQILKSAKTIVWNGPMGKIATGRRVYSSEVGTLEVAKLISSLGAYKVVGGGDTVSFIDKYNLINKFDFVSTGGGAMLEFLSGEKLKGLQVLEK